jgi:hypothetical protein
VLVPHLVVAMPVGMVFIEQQDNAANHHDAGGDQVGAECFLEGEDSEACSNKGSSGKDHRFPGSAQFP